MYTVHFGHGHVATTKRLASAIRLAQALAQAHYGVHVLDPLGNTIPWRTLSAV